MLKEAAYNPRTIDEHSRKLLKKSVKDGLADPPVWNRRTGNVVGGHQRLSVLDELEGNQDYSLDVIVLDVDETKEREINIRLNNQNLMGEYDLDRLANLFINDGVKFSDAGFNAVDIMANFDTPVADQILGSNLDEEEQEVKDDIREIQKIKEARRRGRDNANKKNAPEFFKVIVFDSMESADAFCEHFGLPNDTRYVNGEIVNTKSGVILVKS